MRQLTSRELANVSGGTQEVDEIVVYHTVNNERFSSYAAEAGLFAPSTGNDYGAEPTDEEIQELIDRLNNEVLYPNEIPEQQGLTVSIGPFSGTINQWAYAIQQFFEEVGNLPPGPHAGPLHDHEHIR